MEVQPERIRGFIDIATHPWFVAVCEAVLGPEYRIVEIGFDIPFPGAKDQPWHRDFPSPLATLEGRRLNSLAFNLSAVDTMPEHGALEIALGTQWDDIRGCRDDMFPPKEGWPRYAGRAVRKLPQRGDISARSALTIHRGTANRSGEARPVLVVGVDALDATNSRHHDLQVTRAYLESLPRQVRDHLTYPDRGPSRARPAAPRHRGTSDTGVFDVLEAAGNTIAAFALFVIEQGETPMRQNWPERLWLVRHGQSQGNVARDRANAAGHSVIKLDVRDVDVPLSELGSARRRPPANGSPRCRPRSGPKSSCPRPMFAPGRPPRRFARPARLPAGRPNRSSTSGLREREFGVFDG